jgi:dienelactone hydrolase
MHDKTKVLTLLLIIFFFCQCHPEDKKQFHQQAVNLFEITEIICAADTAQHYCIAFPGDYNKSKPYPLLIVFDPHGNGKLAAEKFKTVVTDFNYILVSSNTIRNGYPSVDYALKILYDDLIQRFKINDKRVYAAGFSGGGRVAQFFSQVNTNVKAIASLGAGYSLSDPATLVNRPSMLFLAGDEDFNYNEVINSDKLLSHSGINYYAYTFHGKHEWPDNEIIKEIVPWFEFDAYRRNKQLINKKIVNDYFSFIQQKVKVLQDEGNYADACAACERGIHFLSGITRTAKLQKKLRALKKHPEYISAIHKKEKAMALEMRLQQGYIAAFNTQDSLWWKKEIEGLNKQMAIERDDFMLPLFKRLKNFLSIIAYSYCNNAFKENNLQKAARYLAIYKMADPDNADVYYFTALLYLRQGNNKMAGEFYRQAVKMGFSDFNKARQEMPSSIFILSEKQ